MEGVRLVAKKSAKSSLLCECNKPMCGCSIPCFLMGIGVGGLLTYPIFGSHPVKWGISLIVIGIIWYFIQLKSKK